MTIRAQPYAGTLYTRRQIMEAVDEVTPEWVRVVGLESPEPGRLRAVVDASWWMRLLCGKGGRRRLAAGAAFAVADRMPVNAELVVAWR